jgi:hypothetical protein
MKITDLIERLNEIKDQEGDVEVTCTACLQPDGLNIDGAPYESTVENFVMQEPSEEWNNKRVRLYF